MSNARVEKIVLENKKINQEIDRLVEEREKNCRMVTDELGFVSATAIPELSKSELKEGEKCYRRGYRHAAVFMLDDIWQTLEDSGRTLSFFKIYTVLWNWTQGSRLGDKSSLAKWESDFCKDFGWPAPRFGLRDIREAIKKAEDGSQ